MEEDIYSNFKYFTSFPKALTYCLIVFSVSFVSCGDNKIRGFLGPPSEGPTPGVEKTLSINPTEDTFLNRNTVNSVTLDRILLYTYPNKNPANSILIKFNVSSIPSDSTIKSATLNLFLMDAGPLDGNCRNGDYDSLTYNVPIYKIIGVNPDLNLAAGDTYDGVNPWTVNSDYSTYNSVYPIGLGDVSGPYDTQVINRKMGFKTWNIKKMIQEWVTEPSTNFGLLVSADASRKGDCRRYFYSKDHSCQ